MMSSLRNLSPEEVIKAFRRGGWKIGRQSSSHVILIKKENPNILSIPYHKGKTIKIGLLKDQIKLAGITCADFLKLLK